MTNTQAMGTYRDVPRMPGPVRVLRVVLVVLAAITGLTTIGVLLATPLTAELVGRLVWAAWPGVLGAVMAARLGPSRWHFVAVVVIAAALLLTALGALGNGDPRGVTGVVIPVLLLVLVLRQASRRWFGVSR